MCRQSGSWYKGPADRRRVGACGQGRRLDRAPDVLPWQPSRRDGRGSMRREGAMADYEVVLDGQSYSAIAVPAPDSGVVDAERNRLLKNLKLESLIANLTRAGEL